MNKKFIAIILLTISFGLLFLSIVEKRLEILHVAHNNGTTMWVYDTQNQRCLSFKDPHITIAKQTCMFLQKPLVPTFNYHKMILAGLYLQPAPKKVLMIGLGGGVIARQLQFLRPNVPIDIVEIDPLILNIAEEFFAFKENHTLRVFIADATYYVSQAATHQQKYDFIILDAFDENYIPPQLLTEKFMLQLKSLLADDGVLAINTFNSSPTAAQETQLALSVFGEFYNLSDTNRIILAMNGQLPQLKQIDLNAAKWHSLFTKLEIDTHWLMQKFNLLR